jgi:hypothetical protein
MGDGHGWEQSADRPAVSPQEARRIRRWARAQGMKVAKTGVLPKVVFLAYQVAHDG